jgi:hypothetical protein
VFYPWESVAKSILDALAWSLIMEIIARNPLDAGAPLDDARPPPDEPESGIDDCDAGTDDEAPIDACDYIDIEAQKRLWVRTIIGLLQLRSHDSDPSGRVQLAFDLVHIAGCEALARILQHVGPRPDGG